MSTKLWSQTTGLHSLSDGRPGGGGGGGGGAAWLTYEAHAIEHGGIEHERHGVGVEGLPAERPHVGAVRKVQLGRDHRGTGLVLLQDLLQHGAGQAQQVFMLRVRVRSSIRHHRSTACAALRHIETALQFQA